MPVKTAEPVKRKGRPPAVLMATPPVCSREQAAEFLGLSVASVDKMLAERKLQRLSDGVILVASVCAELRRRLSEATEEPADADTSIDDARYRKERADKLALENAITRGDFVSRSSVMEEMTSLYFSLRDGHLEIGNRLAPALAGMDERTIYREVSEAHKQLLHQLADGLPGMRIHSDEVMEGAGI